MSHAPGMSGASLGIGEIGAGELDGLRTLSAHVAVVDGAGLIKLVNPAWEAFARDNGGRAGAYIGENYLDVCRKWAEKDADGEAALEGVRAVLNGDRSEFALDYPCHSPSERRWFRMEVTQLDPRQGSGFIVSHIDITQVTLQRLALREIAERVRSSLASLGFNVTEPRSPEPAPAATSPRPDERTALLGEAVAEAHYLAAKLSMLARRADFRAKEETRFAALMLNQWATVIGTDMFEGKNFFEDESGA